MKSTYIIARETFVLLRRDKIFLPMIVVGLCLVFFSSMMQSSSADELVKAMFNMGTAGFFFTGIVICLLWGIKSICESRRDGSIELQLTAPVTRSQWLIGKYLGLCCSLFMVGVILFVAFQLMLYLDFKELMSWKQVLVFVYLFIGWLVFAAICTLFSTFCNTPTATFSSFCVWVTGMLSGVIVATIPPRSEDSLLESSVKVFASFWDFQRFNLVDHAVEYWGVDTFPPPSDLLWFAAYGIAVVVFLLSAATIIFSYRDLV